MDNQSIKWYQKNAVIITLLILFFPAGLYLMWKYASWNKVIKGIITGVFLLLLIASLSGGKTNKTNEVQAPVQQPVTQDKKVINYEIARRWTIPNGGEGKVIVILPENFNEEDMVVLGEKLKEDTKNDRNAFIFVFTDKKAAEMRERLSSLTETESDFFDKHYVAEYTRNINSGFHQYVIYFDSINGTNSKTIKY